MQYPRVIEIQNSGGFVPPADRVIAPRTQPLHVTIAKYDAMRVALGVNAKQ